jgi:site-specific recombinase XerD
MPTATTQLLSKVDDFLDYLSLDKGSSPLTLRNYRHYLSRFAEFTHTTSIEEIDQQVVHDFRIHLSKFEDENGKTLNRRTQSYHIIALRSFLKYLIKHDFDVLSPEKLDIPKSPERQIKFISGEQVDRLLNAPSLSTLSGKRDKAILEVLFSTGLRVSELVKLDRDKVNLDRREFGIVGKGGRARVVFLSSRAAEWLKQYLDARKDTSKALFIRHKV